MNRISRDQDGLFCYPSQSRSALDTLCLTTDTTTTTVTVTATATATTADLSSPAAAATPERTLPLRLGYPRLVYPGRRRYLLSFRSAETATLTASAGRQVHEGTLLDFSSGAHVGPPRNSLLKTSISPLLQSIFFKFSNIFYFNTTYFDCTCIFAQLPL